jgi:cytochrome P450
MVRQGYAHALAWSSPPVREGRESIVPVRPVCPQAGQILGGVATAPSIGVSDGAEHVRARRPLMATFPSSPRKAAAWEPRIRAIAEELVDELRPRGEADLVRGFAWEFAVRVILEVLAVPRDAHERIKRWADGRVAIIWGQTTEAEQVRIANDIAAFWAYCQELVAARVAEPGDDLLSALLEYRAEDGGALSEREVATLAMDVLSAGHETTSNILSNGVLALLSSGSWADLVGDPARIPAAIEEILRYDTPTPGWLRVTTRPVAVGDVEIPAGQRVLVLLGSANRDERRCASPDTFDIARAQAGEHLSFSAGRHFCVGAAFARLEGRVALEVLVERLPGMRLPDGFEPSYEPSATLRLLEALPVAWDVEP